ncbi:putative glucose transporter rco-3 [Alternaria alternata]|nr:putative glucose transporter rco-3 [Alternaria alternata]
MSERSPAMRAPKKVPADKIDTMSEVLLELIAQAPPGVLRPWGQMGPSTSSMKRGELSTPLT